MGGAAGSYAEGGLVLADLVPGARVRDAVLVTACAGLVGLSAQVVIPLPFTPVPITGQTFAVLLGAVTLGSWRALSAMLLYAAVGLAGVPWFAGGVGGLGIVAMPSFGYIAGFVVAGAVVGRLAERGFDRTPLRTLAAMAVGNLVIYACGVPVLAASLGVGTIEALALGLVPFLFGDAVKALLAAGLVPAAWKLAGGAARR